MRPRRTSIPTTVVSGLMMGVTSLVLASRRYSEDPRSQRSLQVQGKLRAVVLYIVYYRLLDFVFYIHI